MAGNISLLATFFGKKTKQIGDDVTDFLVNVDPATMSEADIELKSKKLNAVSQEMQEARKAWNKEQKEADAENAHHDQQVKAAKILEKRLDNATTDAERAEIEAGITKILDEIDAKKDDVIRENNEAQAAKAAFDSLEKLFKMLGDELLKAREISKQAIARQKTAQAQLELAKKAEERAKRIAGIVEEKDRTNIAIDAINKKTEKLENEAAAKNDVAALLTKPKTEENRLVAEAMEEAAGKKVAPSLKDRLAAL